MALTPNNTWHKIAESIDGIDFSSSGLAQIEINGKIICIAQHKNQLFACTQKCPHAGGILAEGYMDVLGNLVCPLHGYKFNPQNGRNISGEGYFLKRYPIEVCETGVFISFPEENFK